LPVTRRLPELELPIGCETKEALAIGNGGSDPMDYHALEAMQCMIERRKGGETGIRSKLLQSAFSLTLAAGNTGRRKATFLNFPSG
jgi:hypothetical protein